MTSRGPKYIKITHEAQQELSVILKKAVILHPQHLLV